MENELSAIPSMKRQHEKDHFMKGTLSLIDNCEKAIKKTNIEKKQKIKRKKKNRLFINEISKENQFVQEKELGFRQLKKPKTCLKRNSQYQTIKKTDLSENQLVFTENELKKLEMIDDFIEKGLQIPDINLKEEPEPKKQQQKEFIPTVDSAYKKQIQRFYDWGENGNKDETFTQINDKNKETVIKHMPKNIEKTRKTKREIMKCNKTLNFHRRFPKVQSRSQIDCQKRKMNRSDQIRNSNTSIFNQLNPSSVPESKPKRKNQRYNSSSTKNSLQKKKEQLEQLSKDISHKYESFPQSTYMTKERNQGLYECQMIRKAKAILSNEEYMNIQFNYSQGDETSVLSSILQESFEHTIKQNIKLAYSFIDKHSKKQIDGILALNRRRLKLERQRIITKLKY